MIGRLEFIPGGRGRWEQSYLYGLPILLTGADPTGWWGEHRVNRAARALKRGGVVRTILPPGFGRWEMLEKLGLRGVEPAPFLRAIAPELAVEALLGRDIDPAGATVALYGKRADGEMLRCAARLCTRVRRVVVDASGGERVALRLREEFGVPVLPPEHPAQLELRFRPREREGAYLELFGRSPELDGLKVDVPGLEEKDREALDVLCLLWERGRLGRDSIKIHRN